MHQHRQNRLFQRVLQRGLQYVRFLRPVSQSAAVDVLGTEESVPCQEGNGYPKPQRNKGICAKRKGDAIAARSVWRQEHRCRKDRAQDHYQRYRHTDDNSFDDAALLDCVIHNQLCVFHWQLTPDHTVFIDALVRNGPPNIPEFNNSLIFKTTDVNL
jgi:hypothetical protein